MGIPPTAQQPTEYPLTRCRKGSQQAARQNPRDAGEEHGDRGQVDDELEQPVGPVEHAPQVAEPLAERQAELEHYRSASLEELRAAGAEFTVSDFRALPGEAVQAS